MKKLTILTILVTLLVSAHGQTAFSKEKKKIGLTSTAFENKAPLPEKYTCDGENVSPPLRWENLPEKTQSIAIIMEDLDSPKIKFTHWIIFNIPSTINELVEDISDDFILANNIIQGSNDFRLIGYDGPCPPSGSPHRYIFKIFALKKELDLDSGATKKQVLRKMRKKVLARGKLIGIYER